MTKKKFSSIIAVLFCFLIFLSSLYVPIGFTYAEETRYPFDTTDPLDDLESSAGFNLLTYQWDVSGLVSKPCIVNFVEWCFSPFKKGDFALYVYFYNPAHLDIATDSITNRIQIASAYKDENGNAVTAITRDSIPNDYDTYQLIHCGESKRTNYEGMFHKFRVVDKVTADGKTIEQRVNTGERRYDVSGITLVDKRGNKKEFTVGGTYYFTGYAAGYGATENEASTLKNSGYTALETISLEVHPTNYRVDGISDLGGGHQWDLTSVYFSVPEEYFTKYGDLQKVKAEWWEYKTQPVVVVNNLSVKNELLPHIGKIVGYSYDSSIPYTICNIDMVGNIKSYYGYYIYNNQHEINRNLGSLNYLFYNSKAGNSGLNDILVSKEALEAYVNSYNASYAKGRLNVGGRNLSADLFQDTVDEGRTRGYNCQEIDANDKVNLLSWNSAGMNWWQQWAWGSVSTSAQFEDVAPINSTISDVDVALSDSNLADTLLIDKNDAAAFRTFYNTAKENGERTVIFHFAKTDYFAWSEKVYSSSNENYVCDCDISTQTVFLDFKIIHLTFKDVNNKYKVIPVVSDPINIYKNVTAAFTPKIQLPDWLSGLSALGKKIVAWVILVVSVAVGVFGLYVFFKLLAAITGIGNVIIQVIFMLLLFAVFIVAYYFAATWIIGVINGLGGLI